MLLEGIREKIAAAATNTEIDAECLALVWMISTKKKEEECAGGIELIK